MYCYCSGSRGREGGGADDGGAKAKSPLRSGRKSKEPPMANLPEELKHKPEGYFLKKNNK